MEVGKANQAADIARSKMNHAQREAALERLFRGTTAEEEHRIQEQKLIIQKDTNRITRMVAESNIKTQEQDMLIRAYSSQMQTVDAALMQQVMVGTMTIGDEDYLKSRKSAGDEIYKALLARIQGSGLNRGRLIPQG
jgi:hypothetical protein